mmetsp:Transcript_58015/g.173152  ORF Transcript_58015/g.173152 Transcript_58015/m.173152 type:complete len:318 (-) Transcript_58015:254-1207(-)
MRFDHASPEEGSSWRARQRQCWARRGSAAAEEEEKEDDRDREHPSPIHAGGKVGSDSMATEYDSAERASRSRTPLSPSLPPAVDSSRARRRRLEARSQSAAATATLPSVELPSSPSSPPPFAVETRRVNGPSPLATKSTCARRTSAGLPHPPSRSARAKTEGGSAAPNECRSASNFRTHPNGGAPSPSSSPEVREPSAPAPLSKFPSAAPYLPSRASARANARAAEPRPYAATGQRGVGGPALVAPSEDDDRRRTFSNFSAASSCRPRSSSTCPQAHSTFDGTPSRESADEYAEPASATAADASYALRLAECFPILR